MGIDVSHILLGPLDLAPGIDRSVDVRAHPHIGLSTVAYLFSGQIMHRDSLGYELQVRPHEVNWMTAGSGITHSERFEHARADLPQWQGAGVAGQPIAGSAYGLSAAAKTCSPLFYAHLDMQPGSTAEIPGGYKERALYIATGAVEVGGMRHESGRMLVLGAAASRVKALEHATVMVLGGEPVGERHLYWNFVSSSKDRLAQAAADWKAGRIELPDADDQEFTPLPDAPPPPVAGQP